MDFILFFDKIYFITRGVNQKRKKIIVISVSEFLDREFLY